MIADEVKNQEWPGLKAKKKNKNKNQDVHLNVFFLRQDQEQNNSKVSF